MRRAQTLGRMPGSVNAFRINRERRVGMRMETCTGARSRANPWLHGRGDDNPVCLRLR
jgi:hypothetical protein